MEFSYNPNRQRSVSMQNSFSLLQNVWEVKFNSKDPNIIEKNDEMRQEVNRKFYEIDPQKLQNKKWLIARMEKSEKGLVKQRAKFPKIEKVLDKAKRVLSKAVSIRKHCQGFNDKLNEDKLDKLYDSNSTKRKLLASTTNFKWVNAKLAQDFSKSVNNFNPNKQLVELYALANANEAGRERLDTTKRRVDENIKKKLTNTFFKKEHEKVKQKYIKIKRESQVDLRKKQIIKTANIKGNFNKLKKKLDVNEGEAVLGIILRRGSTTERRGNGGKRNLRR